VRIRANSKTCMPAAPHILVIRRRYLGDIVLLGSFLRNLRLHWPDARIGVLTEPAYTSLLALNPDVTGAIALPTKFTAWPKFLRKLRRARFTHVFDLDNTQKTALLTRFTGAPERHAFHLENVRRHFPRFYTHTTFVSSLAYSAQHITETYLAMLATASVPVVTRELRLVPRPADLTAVAPLLGHLHPRPTSSISDLRSPISAPKVLLHPGSRSPYRVWPAENFAALCDRIQDELNAQIFLVGGPAEQPILAAIRAAAKSHLVVIDRPLPIGQFAALASQFDLFLCHDSGPMHVAAAVGTPVVALVGAQNITVWGPVGARHHVLQATQPCAAACVAPSECIPGDSYKNLCVRRVTVADAFTAVRASLASPP
jgi:ADP-heptose:LPS heptosyltransferase